MYNAPHIVMSSYISDETGGIVLRCWCGTQRRISHRDSVVQAMKAFYLEHGSCTLPDSSETLKKQVSLLNEKIEDIKNRFSQSPVIWECCGKRVLAEEVFHGHVCEKQKSVQEHRMVAVFAG